MKFRYYITDLHEGEIRGTNSEVIAHDCSMSEDFFVVDTETGLWIQHGNGIDINYMGRF